MTTSQPYNLSETDKQIIAGSVRMLRPFVPLLLKMDKGQPVDEMRDDLLQWIPAGSWPGVVRLHELVLEHGPGLLGSLIAPELGNERWASVVQELAETMLSMMAGPEEEEVKVGGTDAD